MVWASGKSYKNPKKMRVQALLYKFLEVRHMGLRELKGRAPLKGQKKSREPAVERLRKKQEEVRSENHEISGR